MTVVVGVKDGGRVVLAADGQGSRNYVKYPLATPKVFRVGPYALGVAGFGALATAVAHGFAPPPPPKNARDGAAFVAGPFSDALRGHLAGRGALRGGDGIEAMGNEDDRGTVVVAWDGEVFAIEDAFASLAWDAPFLAIGSGAEVALGALHAMERNPTGANIKARIAVEAACRFSDGCGGPVRVVATDAEGDG